MEVAVVAVVTAVAAGVATFRTWRRPVVPAAPWSVTRTGGFRRYRLTNESGVAALDVRVGVDERGGTTNMEHPWERIDPGRSELFVILAAWPAPDPRSVRVTWRRRRRGRRRTWRAPLPRG